MGHPPSSSVPTCLLYSPRRQVAGDIHTEHIQYTLHTQHIPHTHTHTHIAHTTGAHRTRLGASQPHVHVRGGGACGCAPRQHALRSGGAQGRYASRWTPPSSAQECGGRREQELMGARRKRWGTLSLPGWTLVSRQPCPTSQAVKEQRTQHQT